MSEHQTQRLLYVGELSPASTSVARFEALRELGHDVHGFEVIDICRHRSRVLNYLGHRVYLLPQIFAANRRLRARVAELRPNVVWIDKGRWVLPATVRWLKEQGAKVVHYNTDDLYGTEEYFWLHRRGLRHYDVTLTTNRFNVAEIRERFGRAVFRVGMGYDHRIHVAPTQPVAGATTGGPDLIFVGHYEPHTEDFVAAAVEAGLRVDVFGSQWNRARRPQFRRVQRLGQDEYADRIRGAKLALCSLSRRNRNESTGRTFEIPALGGCLLAEDTAEHRWLFRAGREAFLFRNPDDLVTQCRAALAQPGARDAVAAAGTARCGELGLSWLDHLRREWNLCARLFASGRLEIRDDDDRPFWPGFRAGQPNQTLG